jgi:hypothetical protein
MPTASASGRQRSRGDSRNGRWRRSSRPPRGRLTSSGTNRPVVSATARLYAAWARPAPGLTAVEHSRRPESPQPPGRWCDRAVLMCGQWQSVLPTRWSGPDRRPTPIAPRWGRHSLSSDGPPRLSPRRIQASEDRRAFRLTVPATSRSPRAVGTEQRVSSMNPSDRHELSGPNKG